MAELEFVKGEEISQQDFEVSIKEVGQTMMSFNFETDTQVKPGSKIKVLSPDVDFTKDFAGKTVIISIYNRESENVLRELWVSQPMELPN